MGNDSFLMLHELAFVDEPGLLQTLREKLGEGFTSIVATEAELPVKDAVKSYPFNSQVRHAARGRHGHRRADGEPGDGDRRGASWSAWWPRTTR